MTEIGSWLGPIIQGFIVLVLAWTAQTVWKSAVAIAVLSTRVDDHDRRLKQGEL